MKEVRMAETPLFVGIDVSKAQLDVAVRPSGPDRSVPYTEAGIATLVEQLGPMRPTAVVLEATGDLEGALVAAGLPVQVINPRQVRDFARAPGRLAKTDALDARLLAQFAEAVRPTPRPLPDDATQALSALLTRRRQLLDMLTAEKNRRSSAAKRLQKPIEAHIAWLIADLARVDAELDAAIRQSPVCEQDDLLQSIPGVGPGLSRT
jgi:transposase